MWLGEKITDRGIGNGISILIMVGILADLPMAFVDEITQQTSKEGLNSIIILVEVLFWLLVIVLATNIYVKKMKILHIDKNHPLMLSQLSAQGFENYEDYTSSKETIESLNSHAHPSRALWQECSLLLQL